MSKKKTIVTNAMRILAAAGISFETVEYKADEATKDFGVYVSQLTAIPPEQSFKTLVGRGDKTGIIVAVIPVNAEADLKILAKQSGNKKVELISVKELPVLTGYIRGGVSPVGMKKSFPTYVCESCKRYQWMAISGGMCGITLKLAPSDLQRITGCSFCKITV